MPEYREIKATYYPDEVPDFGQQSSRAPLDRRAIASIIISGIALAIVIYVFAVLFLTAF